MRFNHVTLIVSNLDSSLRFYGLLGLKPIVLEQPRYARLVFPDGDETLSLEVTGDAVASGSTQLYFECMDLDERCQTLQRAGLNFIQPPTDMDYLWREARLRDPDGHDIRLYNAGSNRLDPPWKLPD